MAHFYISVVLRVVFHPNRLYHGQVIHSFSVVAGPQSSYTYKYII